MSKRRADNKRRAALARTNRRRALLAAALSLTMIIGSVILAQRSGHRSSTAKDNKPGESGITLASFDAPSKEYVYGPGGRILATEEPTGGGTPPGQGNTVFDFEPDHKTEIGYYSAGLWGMLKSSQQYSYSATLFFSWGGAGLEPFDADFDGDHKADVAYIDPGSGGQSSFAILKSSTAYSAATYISAGFPSLGDTPVVGNFDNDGLADPSYWRSSSGIWFLQKSSASYASIFVSWGQSGDTPIVADFDGDGLSDIGYYRNGLWGVLKSSQGYSTSSPLFFNWGGTGLQPVVADFDNDGKADIGYVAPPAGGQSGAYAILKSTANYSLSQPLFVPAGYPSLGDTPVVGDYDGDGKADPAIWRASQGIWIIPTSSSNYTSYIFSQWGQQGDIPIHSRTSQN